MHSLGLPVFSVNVISYLIVDDKFSLVEQRYSVQVSDTTMPGREQMLVPQKF